MPGKYIALNPELHRYVVEHCSYRGPQTDRVEAAAAGEGERAIMQIDGDQAALISVLVGAIGVRRALEIGTFLGYGALAIARALPSDGELVCCELDPKYADRARATLSDAGLADRVRFELGPAIETLRGLPRGQAFDFAFIDADKTGYPGYVEQAIELVRPGGLIMLDNTLLEGRVLAPDAGDESARTMAKLNDELAGDERVDVAMVTVGDGISLLRVL